MFNPQSGVDVIDSMAFYVEIYTYVSIMNLKYVGLKVKLLIIVPN